MPQARPEPRRSSRIPLIDPDEILGAYLVPSDGIAKAVRIAAALAASAEREGVAFEGGDRHGSTSATGASGVGRTGGTSSASGY